MANLRAKQTGQAGSAATGASPLATVMRKLSLAPEVNVPYLLYGPSFLYSAQKENYTLTPHHRPLTPSQLAEEARATERRLRLVSKAVNIAPQELTAFRAYCEDTSRSLYPANSAIARRFAAALRRLTDPTECMTLAEQELAEEAGESAIVRLMAVPSNGGSGISLVPDTSAEAENAQLAAAAGKDQRAIR